MPYGKMGYASGAKSKKGSAKKSPLAKRAGEGSRSKWADRYKSNMASKGSAKGGLRRRAMRRGMKY